MQGIRRRNTPRGFEIDRDGSRVDLFFADDALPRSGSERRHRIDLYGDPIHILSREDPTIYPATFDRDKEHSCTIPSGQDSLDVDPIRSPVGESADVPGATARSAR